MVKQKENNSKTNFTIFLLAIGLFVVGTLLSISHWSNHSFFCSFPCSPFIPLYRVAVSSIPSRVKDPPSLSLALDSIPEPGYSV